MIYFQPFDPQLTGFGMSGHCGRIVATPVGTAVATDPGPATDRFMVDWSVPGVLTRWKHAMPFHVQVGILIFPIA